MKLIVARAGGQLILGIALTGIAVAGCAVGVEPPVVGGYATVYADDVPVNVEAYPSVAYEGGFAYYVHDRWYYRRDGRWLRMREEPPALRTYRTTYWRPAPPAHRGRE